MLIERVSRVPASRSAAVLPPGWRPATMKPPSSSASWPRRVSLPPKSVVSFVTLMELVRSSVWLVTRLYAFCVLAVCYWVGKGRTHHWWCVGLAPQIPEDLYCLIKKAVAVRKHLERNRKDKDSKYRLILIESRIHRLARYYKRTAQLPPVWK